MIVVIHQWVVWRLDQIILNFLTIYRCGCLWYCLLVFQITFQKTPVYCPHYTGSGYFLGFLFAKPLRNFCATERKKLLPLRKLFARKNCIFYLSRVFRKNLKKWIQAFRRHIRPNEPWNFKVYYRHMFLKNISSLWLAEANI